MSSGEWIPTTHVDRIYRFKKACKVSAVVKGTSDVCWGDWQESVVFGAPLEGAFITPSGAGPRQRLSAAVPLAWWAAG